VRSKLPEGLKKHTEFEFERSVTLYRSRYGWVDLDDWLRRRSILEKTSEFDLDRQKGTNFYVHILDIINRPFLEL
jgi:hypothetical protein